MNDKTDDKAALHPNLDTLRVMRDAARSARQRIIDGRAREAMAIFEHELTSRISTFEKAAPIVTAPAPKPSVPPPPPVKKP